MSDNIIEVRMCPEYNDLVGYFRITDRNSGEGISVTVCEILSRLSIDELEKLKVRIDSIKKLYQARIAEKLMTDMKETE